jgi:hypothetical protein
LLISDKEPDCINCNVVYNKFDFILLFGVKWILGKLLKYKNNILYKKQIHLLESTKGDADKNKKEHFIIEKRSKLLMERRKINKELKDLKAELIQLRCLSVRECFNNSIYNSSDGREFVNNSSDGGEFVNNSSDGREFVNNSSDGERIGDNIVPMCSEGGEIGDNIGPRRSGVLCSYECDGVLNEFYKCIVCSKLTCIHCYTGVEEGHVCPNLINITKGCPGCGEIFTKDNGCDKIKCIKCDTIFNWSTGKIINRNKYTIKIDNYLLNKNFVAFHKLDLSSISIDDKITLQGMHEHIVEFIRFQALKLINILNLNNDNKYKINRINYINNKINKLKFYTNIIKQSKLENYKIYIINIILLAYQKAIELFNKGKDYLKELNDIIRETNEMIINITKYLKYNNNIKILHWFNLNNIDKLIN